MPIHSAFQMWCIPKRLVALVLIPCYIHNVFGHMIYQSADSYQLFDRYSNFLHDSMKEKLDPNEIMFFEGDITTTLAFTFGKYTFKSNKEFKGPVEIYLGDLPNERDSSNPETKLELSAKTEEEFLYTPVQDLAKEETCCLRCKSIDYYESIIKQSVEESELRILERIKLLINTQTELIVSVVESEPKEEKPKSIEDQKQLLNEFEYI